MENLPEITLDSSNRVITQSVRVKPGYYELSDPDGLGAIRVEADDVVIDFQNAILSGRDVMEAKLEDLSGLGINVEGRKNVTIRNAVVQGFYYNIRVLDSENVTIEDCDVSYSRGHRTMDHGAPVDSWLEIRDLAFWRGYGSGIWMEKCEKSTVRHCRGLNAQNGIVLVYSNHCLLTDCDFSFNSGWGIALMQSSDNILSWCLTDFVNRYYVGLLGADSAAVAVSDSSHRNYFVGLSMTHGGDGFFLTNLTDTGHDKEADVYVPKGGSDDNVIAYCDGSWSPANAFEGTFSLRNVYYKNFADYSGHGFWLGFSDDNPLIENLIRGSMYGGISIPSGKGTRIEGNIIEDTSGPAIHLWADENKPSQDFPSRDVEIRGNVIRKATVAINLANTTDYYLAGNTIENAPMPEGLTNTKEPDETTATARFLASPEYQKLQEILATKPEGFQLYRETGFPLGIEWVQMGDYAPQDFRDGLAACRKAGWSAIELYVFDPDGTRLEVPEWAKVTPSEDDPKRVLIEVGPDSARGQLQPYEILLTNDDREQEITGGLILSDWTLKWFRWGEPKLDYSDAAAWSALFAGEPILTQKIFTEPSWPLQRARELAPGVPESYYALEASTRIKFPAGTYKLAAHFAAGGLRISVDGKPVVDNWAFNRYGFIEGTVELAEGEHEITVQQFKEEGHIRLSLYWGRIE